MLRKTSGKRGRGRKPLDFGAYTFTVELALAKPIKHSKKFVANPLGLALPRGYYCDC
jgi:hypothetical protein